MALAAHATAREADGSTVAVGSRLVSDDVGWNFADLWEAIAVQIPDALAQQQGGRASTWAEFNRRANGVAAPC